MVTMIVYNKTTKGKKMKKYEVVISESVAKYIEVKANSEDEAIKMVKEGFWTDEDVVKEDCLDRSVEDVEEVTE